MAASKSRLVVRVVLIVVLLGMIGLAVFAWKNNQPDALWERAQASIKEKDHETAKLHLLNLLKRQPDHADAHFAMATVLRDEHRAKHPNATFAHVPKAVEHLARAAELRPDDPQILHPLMLAYTQSGREGDAKAALKIASQLEKVDRNNADALYLLARDALVSKNATTAGPLLDRLRSLKGEPRLRTLGLQANYYELTKQPKELDAVLVASLAASGRLRGKVSPQDTAALDKLLLAAVKRAPNAAEADRRMAIALQFQERRSTVAKQPVLAAEMTLQLVEAYFGSHPLKSRDSNRIRSVKSVLARSIALTEAAAKAVPSNARVQFALVRLIAFSGDPAKAAATAQAALVQLEEQKPRNDEVELNLHLVAAEALSGQRKYKSALKHAEALIKRGKTETHLSSGHLIAGNIHAVEGRHETALFHFQEARKNGLGQSLRVHFGLANSFAALGRWQEARPHLEALNVKPSEVKGPDASWAKAALGDGSRIRLRLAQAYLATGETQLAAAILNAFKGTIHEPAALALRIVHAWQGDRAAARKQMDAARAKFPTNLQLAYLDIRMYLAANEASKAEAIASEIARKRPMDLTAQILTYSIIMRRQDYPAAVKLLDDLIQRFPKKPVLILAKARTLLDAKKYKEAADAARQLAQIPDWKSAAEYLGALAALRGQNLKDAADRLEALQGGQRQFGNIDLLRGNLSLSQGHPDDAIRELTSALQYTRLQATAGRSLLRSLLVLAYQKSPRDALTKVDGLLKQHPTQASLLLAKAELQSRIGDYSGALATLRVLDSASPNGSDGPYYLARFWMGMNQFADARREIQRALRNAPRNPNLRVLAATIALRENRTDAAIAQLDAGLKLAPKNAGFLLLKATALLRQKKSSDALALLNQLTSDAPGQIQAWLLVAGVHATEKRPEQALKTLEAARKKNPADFTLVRETIRYLVSQKKLDDADKLAASLAGDKPDFQMLSRLTVAFESAGEIGRARQWAEKAMAAAKTAKKQVQIDAAELELANLALAESNKPKADAKWLQEARSRFTAILQKDPKHLVAANNLAWLLAVRMNDPIQARRVIDPIVAGFRLDRLPTNAIDTIMVVYQRQKDFVSLEKLLQEAMRVQPGNSKWIRAYVDLSIQRNRLDAAMTELEQLHRRRGWWPEPSFGMARIYAAMGRPRDALAMLNRALAITPSHLRARLLAVDVAGQLGDSQSVLMHAEAALALNPALWRVTLRQADALKALKRNDESDHVLDAGISRLRGTVEKAASPSRLSALSRLVRAKDGDEAALVVLRDGLKKFPGRFSLVRSTLVLLLKNDRTDDATALLKTHMTMMATVPQRVAVGQAFYNAKQYDAALSWCDKALAGATDDEKPLVWTLTAHAQLGKGQATKDRSLLERARANYEAVLKQVPNHFVAGNNLAYLLAAELDRPADALKVAERIRGDAPVERMNREFIDTISLVYRKAKEWKKARDLLQQATATFATHAPFHLQLGEVYIATKDPQAAQRALRRALQLGLPKPDADQARRLLLHLGKQVSR